jgi:hypothetical protein
LAEHETFVAPTGKFEPDAWLQVGVREPSTLSLAETVKSTVVPPAAGESLLMSAGTETTGSVVSRTVTVKVSLPVLPCASVAEHVSVVAPIGNVAPEAGAQVGVSGPSTLSVAVAVKLTAAPAAEVASAVMFAGAWTTGFVVSTRVTVTSNDALALFPCASVAEHETFVVPTGKFEPDGWSQLGEMLPSMLSFALAEYDTVVPPGEPACAPMVPGTVTDGFVVSTTVTVNDPVADSFPAFVAVQLTVVVPNPKVEPLAGAQSMTASGSSLVTL